MGKTKRNVAMLLRLTEMENALLQQRMQELGVTNREAFVRKMALNGYILKLDLPQLKELISQLRYMGNNLNQLTKRVHAAGRVYEADLQDIRNRQEDIWSEVHRLLKRLGSLR